MNKGYLDADSSGGKEEQEKEQEHDDHKANQMKNLRNASE
jgi:hypothetical protein